MRYNLGMTATKKFTNAEKAKRWRDRNPEASKESKKRSWKKHRDQNIIKSRQKYQANKEKRRSDSLEKYHSDRKKYSDARLKRLFGITQQQYDAMLEAQNYVCAICKQPETMKDNKQIETRKLAVDHCHETGVIRGLLCFACNIGIGKFKHSVKNLQTAIDYLNECDSVKIVIRC